MTAVLSFNQSDILAALRTFLLGVLPAGVEVIKAQANRVPEPTATTINPLADFVVMTPTFRPRLETNTDAYLDCQFEGSISGTTLSVSAVDHGQLAPGSTVTGTGVVATAILSQVSGSSGGAGTYAVGVPQSAAQQTMAAGVISMLQPVDVVVQLDVHGPNGADNAHVVSTAFRDEYALDPDVPFSFAASGVDLAPLWADDPKQVPFRNAEQQYEYRWIVEVHLQANQTVTVPQQFARSAIVGIISVDATYKG